MTGMATALLVAAHRNIYGNIHDISSSGHFHLPDIPEDEWIKVSTPKIRKHATKRRGNKLHDRRRK
jgi:hypothetical protein